MNARHDLVDDRLTRARRGVWYGCIVVASIVVAAGCSAAPPPRSASAPTVVHPHTLEGTWYVVASNLPMWTDGKKADPTFHYDPIARAGEPTKLHDVVRFVEDGKPDSYVGTDTQDPKDESHFTWRGTGFLSFVSAEWYVSKVADDQSWAVVSYSSTIGSPAGVDVISRTPRLAPDLLAQAKAFITGDPVLSRTGGPLADVTQRADASAAMGRVERSLSGIASE